MPTCYTRDPIFTTPQTLTGVSNFTAAPWLPLLNQLPAGRIDANAIKLLNLYPAPTNGNLSSNYADSPVGDEHRNAFDIRMDFNKGDKDQILAAFHYVDDPQFIPGPFGGVADGGAFQQGTQTANSVAPVASWTHTFSPTSVNEARLGYSRLGTSRMGPVSSQNGLPAQYGIAAIPQGEDNGGIPAFGINGLNTLGSNNFLPSEEVSETTQVTDNFTKTYGKHTFKMGIEYQRVRYSTLQPPFSHGQFNFDGNYTRIPAGNSDSTGIAQMLLMPGATSLTDVATAVPYDGGADGVDISNIARTDDGKNYWGTFFEDDFKVSPKLTVNVGLRWDYFGQTFERFGAQANFVPGINGAPAQFLIPVQRESDVLSSSFLALTAKDDINIVYSRKRGLGTSQRDNFAPRIGFAYQWSPKLVVRGGYGMFYDGFESRGYSPNIGENYPFQFGFTPGAANDTTPINDVTNTTYAGTPCANYFAFESGFTCNPLTSSLVGASGMTMRGIQYNYLTPYTQGWNMTFQYELGSNTTITLAYVGNNTHHIEVFPSSNNVNTIILPSADKYNYVTYPDFNIGSSYAATEGSSYYNSLQTSFEKRLSQGLTFLATYTYGRSRSDAGDLLNGGVGEGYRAPTMDGFGIQGDYRDANFDIRNTVHFSGIYALPFGTGRHFLTNAAGAEKQILGGWSLNWNATVEGGQPITIGCPDGTTNGLGCTAFIVPGVNRHGSMTNPFTSNNGSSGFLNAAAFVQPCEPGTSTPTGCVPVPAGSMALLGGGDTQVSGPGISRLDFSVFKDFQLSERISLQFRSEFFNILNHPTFMPPGLSGNGVTGVPGATTYNNVRFGDSGATRFPGQDSRQIQFALKLMF